MNLPSREECEAWDHAQVALFMSMNQMQECIPTVHRLRINGHRLLNLSECDMSKFSLIHQPQLQKIVQDIKKNDSSLLNKLRRLKGKSIPKVPARDYREGEDEEEEHLSDDEYNNETYEEPQEDNYRPPPTQRLFTPAAASFPKGDYLDSCRKRPEEPPRKPFRPSKATKPLPPEPRQVGSDEEDYINPDADNDDNYIEPTEKPLVGPFKHGGKRDVIQPRMLSIPLPQRPLCPDLYEVPDQEENSFPISRLSPNHKARLPSLPPKPCQRKIPSTSNDQDEAADDNYEICDADEESSKISPQERPHIPPKPLPRERSPKPAERAKPDLKPREFGSHTLPTPHSDPNHSAKTHTMDMIRQKPPKPHLFSMHLPGHPDTGKGLAENGTTDQHKDADVCDKIWYAGSCDRKTAEEVLTQTNKDGAFMVRKSSGHDTQQPYTLVVFYNGKVYNIPIRCLETTHQYALGKEKKGEEHFNSVAHIIENHQRTPLVLIDIQNNNKDAVMLCHPVRP